MGTFHYIALDKQGKRVKGVLEGDSARQIRMQLRHRQLKPIRVTPSLEKPTAHSTSRFFQRRISQSDLALLTRQLATLVNANLPLDEVLTAAAQQTRKPRMKTLMLQVRSRVVEGHSLAYALGDFPHIFDDMYRAMVQAGERAGFLGEVLESLADYTEGQQHTKQDLSGAMIYPIILVVIAAVVIGLLMILVVPELVGLFAHTGAQLPTLTQWVIVISEGLSRWWWLILLGIFVIVWGGQRWLAKPARKRQWHRWLLRVPLVSGLVTAMDTARFASTLSILVDSGVPLLEALRIAGEVLSNLELRAASGTVAVAVQEGGSLNKALAQTDRFPPMMVHMVASGEASGELAAMLARSARNQERELKTVLGNLMRLLEPAMIVVMAVVVCAIVLSILLPIVEMNSLVA